MNEFIARNGIISKSNLVVSGSLTALSSIVAQTLVVQTITSSISSITGSTNFGSLAANTHTFTGSILTSGSIGIGTNSTSYPIDIFSNISSSQNIQAQFYNNDYTSGTRNFIRVRNSINVGSTMSSYFGQGQDGKTYIISNDFTKNHIVIDGNSGNIGVGTNNPLTTLDVRQAATGNATVNVGFRDSSTNGNALQIWNGNNEARFRAVYYGTPSDQSITFYTITSAGSEGERMRITSGGNVSIGTSNTTARLNVQASSNFETATLGTATGTMGYLSANGLYGMYIGVGNSGNTWLQSQRNDANTSTYSLLLNPQGGNVGIGTTSPISLLSISRTLSADSTHLTLDNKTNTKYNWGMNWAVNDSSTIPVAAIRAIYPADNDISLGFYTYNGSGNVTERMRITPGGVLRFSNVPFNNYQIDSSIVIAVASGGTIPFETFSGLIIINNMTNGVSAMWLCGAGSTSLIGQGAPGATGTLSYSVGINGYVWTAPQTANYGVFAVRTRANA